MPSHPTLRMLECRLCGSDRLRYAFSRGALRLEQCEDCDLLFQNPQPSDAELAKIYSEHYSLSGDSPEDRAMTARMKRGTAELYLEILRGYTGGPRGALLEVGCGDGDFLAAAHDAGYDITGLEISAFAAAAAEGKVSSGRVHCGDLSDFSPRRRFDVCVLSDVIEHTRDPLAVLARVRELLVPGGALFVALPSLDSWSARLLSSRWMEFKAEHLFHFDRSTVESALWLAAIRPSSSGRGSRS